MIVLFFSYAGIVKADISPPSLQTAFYFQKDGQPLMQPVKFSVKCYGISKRTGNNKLLKLSEFSETCQSYGCKFDTSYIFWMYKTNTQYCDLEGEVNGENFTVNNFLGDHLSGLSCHRADFDLFNDKYCKETPKYKDCLKDVHREYYPKDNGKVLGDFLCDKYLIPSTLSTEPRGPCDQYGYKIINNKCYKMDKEFFACTAELSRKEHICDKYLEDVTPKLAKDKNGQPFDQICEVKVNVPVGISKTNNRQTLNVEPTSPVEQPLSRNIFTRIINFFSCSFLKLFEKSS